jgi:hypothetical protein
MNFIFAVLITFSIWIVPAVLYAQVQFPTANPNAKVYGAGAMCLDTNGVAQPALNCNAFQNIAANGTTTLKSGKGWLRGVTINKAGASANTLTLYDNTAGSGTKIATIDTTVGIEFNYDLQFNTGLTVVLATGTAADVTVTWK